MQHHFNRACLRFPSWLHRLKLTSTWFNALLLGTSLFATDLFAAKTTTQNRTQIFTIAAPSLAGNLIETPAEQGVYVYLPKSYFESDQRYPVVYYLHGYDGSHLEAMAISGRTLDRYSEQHSVPEMIVVGVNASNQFGGGFYQNSPVSGHWEDFIVNDLVNYIDSHYRTLPQAEQRGLAGFSMGGYGALKLGFKHPDKFQHLFALSPAVFAPGAVHRVFNNATARNWTRLIDGYAAAFAPNPQGKDGQFWHEWDPNNAEIVALHEAGYGDWNAKVADYLAGQTRLNAIHIEYGLEAENYPWIPEGSRYLLEVLKENQINATSHDHGGSHIISYPQANHIIAFFSDAFTPRP